MAAMQTIGIFVVVAAMATMANAAVQPPFPEAYHTDLAQESSAWEGGTHNESTGEICCDMDSPACRLQAMGGSLSMYVDGSINATLLTNGQQGVLTLFDKHKQMQVVPSKSGKGWHCTSYCKVSPSDWQDPLAFDKTAVDLGSVTIEGKQYEKYQWYEGIGPKIHMERNIWYVDQSDPKNPVPYKNVAELIPFGGPEVSEGVRMFESFQPGKPDPSLFLVDNIDMKSCQKDSKSDCEDDSTFAQRFSRTASVLLKKKQEREAEKPSTKHATRSGKDQATAWPGDWTSNQILRTLVNQGGYIKDSQVCCGFNFGEQCQVQVQYRQGASYHDASHNRTRIEDPATGDIINDYNIHKSLSIIQNGSYGVCQSFCPIDPSDTVGTGKSEFVPKGAKDLGDSTWNGKPAHVWQWNSTLFGLQFMRSDLYVDMTGDIALPLGRIDHLTPWGGPQTGTGNDTFATFVQGTPPASKFVVRGVEQCPQSDRCGEPVWQAMRLREGLLHTYLNHAFM